VGLAYEPPLSAKRTVAARTLFQTTLAYFPPLETPLKRPSLPIYMIWHETRPHDDAHVRMRELVATELGRTVAPPSAKFRPQPCPLS
jgi:hypothetical protein